MKYLELKALVKAIQPLVKDAFINKLDFVDKKTLQLRLRKFTLIARPPDFFFVDDKKHLEALKKPLSPTMAFRKYVSKGVLKDVEIIPNNRIIKLTVRGARQEFYIFIEFFGSCDFILTDTNLKILALLKYYKNKNRELRIHNTYIIPESHHNVDDAAVNGKEIMEKQKKGFWENESKSKESPDKIKMFQKKTLEKYLRQKDEFEKKGKYILENLNEIQKEFNKARASKQTSFKFNSFVFSTDKGITKQAEEFFEKSKKLKEKIAKIEKLLIKKKKPKKTKEMLETIPCTEFYAKYHWFFSSSGILCFGGRSAQQNEEILKNLVKKEDLILHTDLPGSPFFIIRGKKIDKQTIQEAAQATVSYSRYWRNSYSQGIADVFRPDQIKKTKDLPIGSFLVEGKVEKVSAVLEIAIGVEEVEEGKYSVIGGPTPAILQKAKKYVILQPGDINKPQILKKISERLRIPKPEIEKFLPSGKYKLI